MFIVHVRCNQDELPHLIWQLNELKCQIVGVETEHEMMTIAEHAKQKRRRGQLQSTGRSWTDAELELLHDLMKSYPRTNDFIANKDFITEQFKQYGRTWAAIYGKRHDILMKKETAIHPHQREDKS